MHDITETEGTDPWVKLYRLERFAIPRFHEAVPPSEDPDRLRARILLLEGLVNPLSSFTPSRGAEIGKVRYRDNGDSGFPYRVAAMKESLAGDR